MRAVRSAGTSCSTKSASLQMIDQNAIDAAQEVRVHRNHLVHQRIEDHAGAMTIEERVETF